MERLSRCAVVTGAASGIGAAIAARLEDAGMDVVAVDLRPDPAGPGHPVEADTAVCPGFVRTPLVQGQLDKQAAAFGVPVERALEDVILAPHAIKRLIEPEEVAGVVAFLLGPGGGAFSGAPVTMDLGWTAR